MICGEFEVSKLDAYLIELKRSAHVPVFSIVYSGENQPNAMGSPVDKPEGDHMATRSRNEREADDETARAANEDAMMMFHDPPPCADPLVPLRWLVLTPSAQIYIFCPRDRTPLMSLPSPWRLWLSHPPLRRAANSKSPHSLLRKAGL